MPIAKDEKQLAIDFKFEGSDGNSLFVKYHYHEGKPAISISEDKQQWFVYPAELFSDVTDFLREEGVIPGGKVQTKPAVVQSAPVQNIVAKTEPAQRSVGRPSPPPRGKLPIPEVTTADKLVSDPEPLDEAVEYDATYSPPPRAPIVAANDEPLENFAGLEALVQPTVPKGSRMEDLDPQTQAEIMSRPVFRKASIEDAAAMRGVNPSKAIGRVE